MSGKGIAPLQPPSSAFESFASLHAASSFVPVVVDLEYLRANQNSATLALGWSMASGRQRGSGRAIAVDAPAKAQVDVRVVDASGKYVHQDLVRR
jgi:hypothetical protein